MGAFDRLSTLPVWVAWQTENRENRTGVKVPHAPNNNREARTNDPSTWGTRAQAEARASTLPNGGGIGIVLGELCPGEFVSGIDLDTCRDDSGTLAPWAQAIVTRFKSYTEISPSGTGLKIFFRAATQTIEAFRKETKIETARTWSKPTGGRHPPAVELYLTLRYFTVTGDRIGGSDELRLVALDDLLWLVNEGAPPLRAKGKENTASGGDSPPDAVTFALTEADMREAFTMLPNADLDWDTWNKHGMAIYAASEGADWGYDVFREFSQKSPKFNEEVTLGRWQTLKRSPPSRIGAGSIVWWVREIEPDWIPPSHRTGKQGLSVFSDEAMALNFADRHEQTLRFTAELNRWHHWDSTRWRPDKTLYAFSLVRDFCRRTSVNAPAAQKSGIASAKKVASVVMLTRADRRVAATIGQWNRDPWLLGTPGGTIDLRTGALRDADLEDYITKLTAAIPIRGRGCDLWEQTLLQIAGGDVERVRFLQRIAGYALTGSTQEERVFFLYGKGRNGKGAFIETLLHVLGDYGTTVAMTTLLQTKYQEHPTEIAKLNGVRLAVASETMDGQRWNSARIKTLTGGDRLTGRFMRQDLFDFNPTHTLVVSSNRQPALGQVDFAMAARMVLIHFTVTFNKQDQTLKPRLREEADGILLWAVRGCLDWQRQGLAIPADVVASTSEYLKEQDDIELFLSDCTIPDDTKVPFSSVFTEWQRWCERSGAYSGHKREFARRLEDRDLKLKKSNSVMWVYGIRLGEPELESSTHGSTQEYADESGDFDY